MPFPVPSSLVSGLDAVNSGVEEAFKAGDMARLVENTYIKEAKVLPSGHTNMQLSTAQLLPLPAQTQHVPMSITHSLRVVRPSSLRPSLSSLSLQALPPSQATPTWPPCFRE